MVRALVQVRSTVPQGTRAQVLPVPGGQLIGWLLALRTWKFAAGCAGKPSFSRHSVLNSGLAGHAAAALDVGIVAVDVRLLEVPRVDIALHRPMVGDRVPAIQGEQLCLVLGGLRPSVDRLIVSTEELDRRRPDHAEIVVGRRRDQMNFRIGAPPAEVAVEAAQPRRRLVAPAIVLQALARQIERPFALPDAVLQRPADAAIGTARCVGLGALIGEAVLHLEAHRAAERIEAEGRVVGPDVGAADRDGRDHVPVDGVAEGLVDADAVHVDREPLRRALQRRRHEAAIAKVLGPGRCPGRRS